MLDHAASPDVAAPHGALRHAERLDHLARVIVQVGCRVVHGQQVVLTAPLDAVPLVRRITEHAYRAGASLVTTILGDEATKLMRFQHGADDTFDDAPAWLYGGMSEAFRTGAARLSIVGEDPALLSAQDPDKVARANRAASAAIRPVLERITRFEVNWSLAACATPSWARAMFPDLPEDAAVARLWDAIFATARIPAHRDGPDPVAAWQAHNEALHARTRLLNDRGLAALHFKGPGTDLRVGLSDGHTWLGGAKQAGNGVVCNPNIPTEEVFTTPHKDRVEGVVASTKPLSYQGTLIQDIVVRFEGGRITEARARTGETVLTRVLDTDEGARRLGEVALVPHSSPISASGLLFQNTLFDENAASHIALGQAYSNGIAGGEAMDEAALAARGANRSLIHIDWMIGSGQVDVDGITADGRTEAVMRRGEWV